MKKQRWRKTKILHCWLCPNKIDKTKGFQVDFWSYHGKKFVRCHICKDKVDLKQHIKEN